MQIEIICLGKNKEEYVRLAEREYLKRVMPWCKLSITELDIGKFSALPENQRKEKEAQLLLNRLGTSDFVVVMDENGKKFSSQDFAGFFEKTISSGKSRFQFLIGGVFGWDLSILERANLVLSLSPMTFTYQMSRVILVEQIYRALSIINGSKYHKGNISYG